MDKNIIYRGAEAEIVLSNYLGKKVVKKERITKSYRIKEIDSHLISYRTKEEAKLISESRKCGVSVPLLYDVDLKKCILTMQFLNGKRIKDIINNLDESRRKNYLCFCRW